MEISPIPRRRSRPVLVRVLVAVVLLAPVTGLALVPTLLGLERSVMRDDSMGGTMGRGSVTFERLVPVGDLEVGDVITYPVPSGYGRTGVVTHRIVSIEPGIVRTQGDANPEPDPWLVPTPTSTQERVVLHIPYIGYPFIASAAQQLWTLVLLGPVLLIGVTRVVDSTRRRHRPERTVSAVSRVTQS